MPIWILEHSRDQGKTWRLEQPYKLFKDRDKALTAAVKMNEDAKVHVPAWRIYRATEYRPVVAS
jgi:hypothetical protein